MKNFIITGASKGLGEGIALSLINPDHHLVSISRTKSEQLENLSREKKCQIDFLYFDLSITNKIDLLMKNALSRFDKYKSEGFYLINNAGVINPVGPAEECHSQEIEDHVKINLIAAMITTAKFIKLTEGLKTVKRVVNISSGAAQFPYYGWSSYCTSKAGLDMFTKCIATEQQNKQYPVEIMSVAPGIIDTNMQETIRKVPENKFIHRNKFIEYKEKGLLVPPLEAGRKIKELLMSDKFQSGEITDLRNNL